MLSGIPGWCIMPTMFPFLAITERYGEAYYLLHMHEIMTIGSMYLWRAGRGVYRFSSEVYDALIHQPLSGDLPIECLYHLPEWAVYIETPGIMFGSWPMDGSKSFSILHHSRYVPSPSILQQSTILHKRHTMRYDATFFDST